MIYEKKIMLLQGGLGNQLYQLAEFSKNCDLSKSYIFDATNLSSLGTQRDLNTDIKGIFEDCFITSSKFSVFFVFSIVLLFKLYRRISNRHVETLKLFNYRILYGYFQNPHVESEYFLEFCGNISRLLDAGQSFNKDVAIIHVRLGDYKTSKAANKVHGVLDLAYYAKAVRAAFEQGFTDFKLISDSPKDLIELKKHLEMKLIDLPVTLVVCTSTDYLKDFSAMLNSGCIVGSNSTFSLWASYLNRKAICIFPKNWYRNQALTPPSFREDVIKI